MADITLEDVLLIKAEDQTDGATGGGMPGSQVVVSGVLNNLFPNISRVDRLNGRIQLRKVFPAIASNNTETYSGAHVIVKEVPTDPEVSVLLFESDDFAEERSEKITDVETFYQSSVPVGNAGLEYAVVAGETQLVFKILHYEYTPVYNMEGALIYSRKMDARYTCNISVGDLLVLEEGGTTEFIQIKEIEKAHEELDNATEKHYYVVDYLIVTLSYALQNGFSMGIVPKRTVPNTAWKCYGTTTLSDTASVGDNSVEVTSTKGRLAPTIARTVTVQDQGFFSYPQIENEVDIIVEDTVDITITLDNVNQIQVSEYIDAVAGKKAYVHAAEQSPIKSTTMEIWYVANGGWWCITDASVGGTLEGDGTGTVSSDGVITFTTAYPPDEGTKIIFIFVREHDYAVVESQNLANGSVNYNEDQYAVPAEQATATGTLGAFPVEPGWVNLYVYNGNGWEVLGTDGGGGIITGANIDTCIIDYTTGAWSLTVATPYQDGVVLKFESIGLSSSSASESLAPAKHGTLSSAPVMEGTVVFSFTIEQYHLEGIRMVPYNILFTVVDNNGSLYLSSDMGSSIGSIDYKTGKFTITKGSSPFDKLVITLTVSYSYYGSSLSIQGAIPWNFSLGKTDIVPNSIVLKYFTDEMGAIPIFAIDNGVGDLLAYNATLVSDFTSYSTFQSTIEYWGYCVALGHFNGIFYAIHRTSDVTSGSAISISYDGQAWNTITNNFGNNFLATSAVAANNNYVIVVGSKRSGSTNAELSTNAGTTFSSLTIGVSTDALLDIKWSEDLSLWIAIADSKIFTSPTGLTGTWTERTTPCTVQKKIIVGTKDGSPRIVVLASGSGCYSDDGIVWVGTNCRIATPYGGDFQAGNEIFWACGSSNGLSYSTNGGESWTAIGSSTVFSTSCTIVAIACSNSGAIFVHGYVADTFFHIGFSPDSGVTWSDLGEVETDATYDSAIPLMVHDKVSKLLYLTVYQPLNSYPRPVRPWVCNSVSLDSLILGEINYETGIGALTFGDAPTSATARHFLYPREISSYILTTRGASPIQNQSLTITARSLNYNSLIVYEDPEDPGVLIGNGSGTVDNDTGVAIVEFDVAVLPETISLSFTYGSVYHPTYDEINTRGMPVDGLVPLIQTGDVLVITDGVNQEMLTTIAVSGNLIRFAQSLIHEYAVGSRVCSALVIGDMVASKTLDFSQATWNGTTWGDVQEGSSAPDSYDWANFPLTLSNNGAITERWVLDVVGVNPLRVDVIGENTGTLLNSQAITGDIAPENPNTGTPYWTLDADGWPTDGGNFQSGNVIRFNTDGAIAPLWVCRVVNAGSSEVIEDSATIEIRGDVSVTTTTT